jgi:hypothetical protein
MADRIKKLFITPREYPQQQRIFKGFNMYLINNSDDYYNARNIFSCSVFKCLYPGSFFKVLTIDFNKVALTISTMRNNGSG